MNEQDASTKTGESNTVPRPKLRSPSWQAKVREAITPYLPPPVVQGIRSIDEALNPHVGAEATVTLGSTILLAWWTVVLLRFVAVRLTGSGRAIADDSKKLQSTRNDYQATVLLCGPRGGGKTSLFYQLYCNEEVPTVRSIQANVAVAPSSRIRYVDWPGLASLDDEALQPILKASPLRVVLVLDSTQSMASAADALDALLQLKLGNVAVACHQQDREKAKNLRRIKLQMRGEMERLCKARGDSSSVVDLESLPGVVWLETSKIQMEDLRSFCETGKVP